MEKDRPSATAQGAAVVRALHQILDDEPRILDDTIAARLVGEELERHKRMVRLFGARGLRANFAMRSRYAEDCLAESLGDGVGQYVLLGAGLDTFAYRQPAWAGSLRIFEVDCPATQKWKRAKLAAAEISIPVNVTLVPVDFERTSLKEGLAASGLDLRIPTFFSSLGVTQYLTEEALDLLLNFVLTLPPASEIVFSFVLAGSALSWRERAFCRVCRYRWRERRAMAESIFPATACQQTDLDRLFESNPLFKRRSGRALLPRPTRWFEGIEA
jgi:methyltransferase (TIGR00027 family)